MTDLAQPTSDLAGFTAGRLSFAASPLFAAMAAFPPIRRLHHLPGRISPVADQRHGADVPLLMSLFHLTPWLTLLSQRLAAQPDPIHTIQGD